MRSVSVTFFPDAVKVEKTPVFSLKAYLVVDYQKYGQVSSHTSRNVRRLSWLPKAS